MKYNHLILEKKEYVFLKRILNISEFAEDFQLQKLIKRFNWALQKAEISDATDMPIDIVRFNSICKVQSSLGWEKTISIVAPSEKNINQNKISVLSPIGLTLFGYAESDSIIWEMPTSKQQLQLLRVTNTVPADFTY